VLIVVTIDEPKGSIYGGVVAAPTFSKIASFCMSHLQVPPSSGKLPASTDGLGRQARRRKPYKVATLRTRARAYARISGFQRRQEAVETTDLVTLLEDLDRVQLSGTAPVSGIAYRSDRVTPGDVFFCIPGFEHDGHEFAHDAVARGAVALVAQHTIPGVDVPTALVDDSRKALAVASARFYGSRRGT